MNNRILTIALAICLFLSNCLFIVNEKEQALIFQFGEFIRVVDKPGLSFKLPLIHTVKKFSKMILHLNADAEEVITLEQKRSIVNAYAKYQIIDALQFFRTVSDDFTVKKRLNAIFDSSLRQIIGGVNLSTLLSSQRHEVMENIKNLINNEAQKFGVKVIDVRILRVDLPEENSNAIYKRMQTDREKEAREFRAEGAEEGARIRAKADKESDIIMAEGAKQAELIKAQGDTLSNKIYANAYNKDLEFFSFYRNLISYKKSFIKDNTFIILSPDNEFLKVFNGK
jgi:membrane protease subunit HflC